jgi:hypothetical protein
VSPSLASHSCYIAVAEAIVTRSAANWQAVGDHVEEIIGTRYKGPIDKDEKVIEQVGV